MEKSSVAMGGRVSLGRAPVSLPAFFTGGDGARRVGMITGQASPSFFCLGGDDGDDGEDAAGGGVNSLMPIL